MNMKNDFERKTFRGVLLSSVLSEPLFTLYGFTAFILRKHLDATAFQIAFLTMLRPLVSILSFYWSANLSKRRDKLRSNFLGAGFLSRLPFLFLPFINQSWYLIFSVAIYILFYRAGTPAWIEILKLNLPKKKRENVFSWGFSLQYIEGMILAIGVGSLLDQNPSSWKILFFISAILGMLNLYFMSKIPINHNPEISQKKKESLKTLLLKPWKNSFYLMKTRRDFSLFQWSFMFCGFGVMLIQPVIPFFLADILKISYIDFAIAFSLCKGLGIVFSSPIWSRLMHKISLAKLSFPVFILFGLQPLLLCLAPFHLMWLYLSYILYGIAQGGSHLIWHFSGPTFSGKEDSSLFSGVNVVMVGIRGAIAPPLGGALSVLVGPISTLLCGSLFCMYSSYFLFKKILLQKISTADE